MNLARAFHSELLKMKRTLALKLVLLAAVVEMTLVALGVAAWRFKGGPLWLVAAGAAYGLARLALLADRSISKCHQMPPLRRHGDAQGGVLHRRPAASGRTARRQPRADLLLHLGLAEGRCEDRAEHQGRLPGEARR